MITLKEAITISEKYKNKPNPEDETYSDRVNFINANGFDYADSWDLDMSIMAFILPRLVHLRDVGTSYPSSKGINSMEEWINILNEIIDSFYLYLSKDIYSMTGNERLKILSGRQLFCEYFEALWD